MSESVRQSLSALMDNEADPFELRRTLQQVDEGSAAVWARYHLASAVLHGDTPLRGDLDVSAAVQLALVEEPAYEGGSGRAVWKPLASIAVAASVTAMVMFGAQSFAPDSESAAGGSNGVVLTAPQPLRAELLPAQYGAAPIAAPSSMAENDVIRLSSSMEYYIHQHHALMRDRSEQWSAGWLPAGYSQVRHDLMSDAEVILYSDGRSAISVSIEPYGKHKARDGAAQHGDTVAFGKRVGGQFVTVVGDLPLMMADRIASSVTLVGQ